MILHFLHPQEGSRYILRALRFKLTYEIIQKEPRPVPEGGPLPNINEYPILNQKGALRKFEGTFAKDCGNDTICNSDLHVTGSLELEEDTSRGVYLLRLGEYDTVPLLLEVTNRKEPAYMTTLYVRHNEALFFDPTDSEVSN
ncbi:Integrin alpha ina-1 [Portunus trituberculatus]|uniref:Integrin alpha ina-1 n=1 Tax=Portunus trituberculatus TaxID=210409 RepID=A0A5B7INK5_PORTR|nr:Integrin alpha ina-1 [Portunus trituberculatus]